MGMILKFRIGWVFLLLLSLAQQLPGQPSGYRGFTVDESAVRGLPNLEEIRTALREQIEMVCAVGLPPEIMTFFQKVPLVFVPAESVAKASPGLYLRATRNVKLTSRILVIGRRPVLLHELLHAYHDQRLPKGTANPEILAFYEAAKSLNAYGTSSHMMKNVSEFFACSGTTYLFGVTAQEPFKRTALQEHQPALVAHLQSLFGPSTGTYQGVLTR